MNNLKIKGTSRRTIEHSDGTVEKIEEHNMIVTSGFNLIISSLITSGSGRPNTLGYVAIGSGTTAPNASQTTLVSEQYRKAGSWTWSAGSKTFTITSSWDKGAVVGSIAESGVFNASSGGSMFDRVVFENPSVLTADDKYTQEFEFEVM